MFVNCEICLNWLYLRIGCLILDMIFYCKVYIDYIVGWLLEIGFLYFVMYIY